MDDALPVVTGVGRCVDLAAARAEIHSAFVEGVDGHRVAQNVYETILLRQSFSQGFPFVAAGLAAIDAELAVRDVMFRVALNGTT